MKTLPTFKCSRKLKARKFKTKYFSMVIRHGLYEHAVSLGGLLQLSVPKKNDKSKKKSSKLTITSDRSTYGNK